MSERRRTPRTRISFATVAEWCDGAERIDRRRDAHRYSMADWHLRAFPLDWIEETTGNDLQRALTQIREWLPARGLRAGWPGELVIVKIENQLRRLDQLFERLP